MSVWRGCLVKSAASPHVVGWDPRRPSPWTARHHAAGSCAAFGSFSGFSVVQFA